MTLSAFLMSVAAGMTVRPQGPRSQETRPDHWDAAEHDGIRRYALYRKAFADIEITCPAMVLRDTALARWVRKHALAVDVRTSGELAIAVANGIHSGRIVVHGDSLCDPELRCAANVGVGRVILDSASQVDFLALCSEKRAHGVLIRTTDPGLRSSWEVIESSGSAPLGASPAPSTDHAIAAVLGHRRLSLLGLDARIGLHEGAFVSCMAAIGHLISEMARVRVQHAIVLRQLGLHIDLPLKDSDIVLRSLADRISATLDDACATMRFPRPRVLLSLDPPSVEYGRGLGRRMRFP